MPQPRKTLISLSDTPYYHCVSRCVRRAYLCGTDRLTGQSYEHRRQWVKDRLLLLGSIFAINICAYAVMSNHTHVVMRVDREKAQQWTTEEVLHRWLTLHKGTVLVRRFIDPVERKRMTPAEIKTVESTTNVYRQRLYCISWFMRLLNEYIARQANKEDDCTGRFWEGRFKSQALLDEAALAACMAYVDLNPLRAGIVETPEAAMHTSIQKRIKAAKINRQPRLLCPLAEPGHNNSSASLPFGLSEYLTLVEQTASHLYCCNQNDVLCTKLIDKMELTINEWNWLVTGVETQFSNRVSLQIAYQKSNSGKKVQFNR